MTTSADDQAPHTCVLIEEHQWGRVLLGPCRVCGRPAAEVLEQLRGDRMRAIVQKFISEAPRYFNASMGAETTAESDRWRGEAQARSDLFEALKTAGVDVEAVPQVSGPSTPSPRHAQAVRALHVLEPLDPALGVSACKADGYVSADLETDPCPTLAALNETDPPPDPALIDVERLAARIYGALTSALCNGGHPETGWSLMGEARQVADAIAADLPAIDLADPTLRREIGRALAAPAAFVPRKGAVPQHQLDAVLAVLRKATK